MLVAMLAVAWAVMNFLPLALAPHAVVVLGVRIAITTRSTVWLGLAFPICVDTFLTLSTPLRVTFLLAEAIVALAVPTGGAIFDRLAVAPIAFRALLTLDVVAGVFLFAITVPALAILATASTIVKHTLAVFAFVAFLALRARRVCCVSSEVVQAANSQQG